ncbi:HNH endonuclease [Virgibacillus halodenitrificans]|uniref:HNH endonuclease n=1 Tax=Virgibacillus halodenitrificans TaxID=1482 RepID=UPI001FB5280A|nr:HNH endonuclease [Virgibacillus halodenitrificans]MCJ0932560.1 HNH endonuclease [Virgibacillus halodenitrificans]
MPEYKTKEQQKNFYNSPEWKGPNGKRWDILERDNYECVWCKEEGFVTVLGGLDRHGNEVILEVDHIKELEDHPEFALEDDNLRTLCKDCHNKRHKRFNYKARKKEKKWDDEWW